MGSHDAVFDFENAVAPHVPTLWRFAASLVARDDVDDLVQDALLRAWQRRDAFDSARGSMRAWLLAFVADQARQRWRRRRLPTPVEQLVAVRPGPDGLSTDVRRAIATLPARQRTAIVLRHYVDLDYVDIAAVMGCSVGTVRSNLHDARAKLADLLGDSYVAR